MALDEPRQGWRLLASLKERYLPHGPFEGTVFLCQRMS